MVVISICPTKSTVGIRPPSQCLHSDETSAPRGFRGMYSPLSGRSSQLNRWSLSRREGLVQRDTLPAPMRRCCVPVAPVVLAHQHDITHQRYISWCVVMLPSQATRQLVRRTAGLLKSIQEQAMFHKEVVAHIARRLPHRTRRDVREVIDLLIELWSDELTNGNEVLLPNIGKLSIEVQDMQAGGALVEQGRLQRVYGRFRPTPALKKKIKETQFE